jgi:4-amino-4-deoxy-L-arabinose transferase-like glycosyltransferase
LANHSAPPTDSAPIGPRLFWLGLIAITAFAACIRLYRLGDYPQNFTVDEMSSGYEAWSLWTTGADQHGNVMPLHLRRFNDYAPALPIYLSAPVVGLLGLGEFSARLPYALMGIGAVFGTAILGRHWFGPVAGLLAALFLAIDPWAVNFSRMAYPLGSVPLFTVLSLYAFTRFMDVLRADVASRRGRLTWAALCALCFALLTLAYEPMKLQGPLLVATCLLAAHACFRQRRRLAVLWIGLYVLLISPLLIDQVLHGPLLQRHFAELTLIGKPDGALSIVLQYILQYSPLGLFLTGLNRSIEAPAGFGIGELFWLEGALWIAAAVALARHPWLSERAGFRLPLLFAIWFATFPLAASLTSGASSHREINFLPLPELLAGFGAVAILGWLARTRFKRRAVLYAGVAPGLVLLICFGASFLQAYFSPPLLESADPPDSLPYSVGLRPALAYLTAHADPCDEIWLEPTFSAYMAYLFYTRYPPAKFQHAIVFKKEDSAGWLFVPWMDGIWFATPGESPAYHPPLLASCRGKPSRVWYVGKKQRLATWPTVFSVDNARGESVWRVQVKERKIVVNINATKSF